MSQTVKQHWRNMSSPLTLSLKRSWDSRDWDATHSKERSISVFVFLVILMRGSWWRVRVKMLPMRCCRTLWPEDKLGANALETSLCVHLEVVLTLWLRHLSDTAVEEYQKKGVVLQCPVSIFFSIFPSPHFHHLLPCRCQSCCYFPLASCTHSSARESWQCCGQVPQRGIFTGCDLQPASGAPRSTLCDGAGEKSWGRTLCPPYQTDLWVPLPCSRLLFAFRHYCCDI